MCNYVQTINTCPNPSLNLVYDYSYKRTTNGFSFFLILFSIYYRGMNIYSDYIIYFKLCLIFYSKKLDINGNYIYLTCFNNM